MNSYHNLASLLKSLYNGVNECMNPNNSQQLRNFNRSLSRMNDLYEKQQLIRQELGSSIVSLSDAAQNGKLFFPI
jgi:hypothetical protein